MKIKLLGIALLTWFSLNAQNFDKSKMDSLFSIIKTNQKGMGSISIFKNGKEVYQNSFGYASIEGNVYATKETKYRIGSISKTFTATIIMKLIEQDKLSFDTKLSKYFSEVPNSENITIEQLLRHRSGIFDYTKAQDYLSWMEQPISKEKLVKKITDYGNVFKPNEKTEYSNTNYVLLSYIAEKIINEELFKILDDFIIKPCGLINTYYGSKININNNEALSYIKLKDWQIASETDMSVPVGAGAITSNPTELNIFLNCLFNGKIITEESLKRMMNIQEGFGIGLFQIPFFDKTAFGHSGGIDGFQSNVFYFPDEKISLAYTSNGVVMPMNDILIGALSIYFGNKYELPIFTDALVLKSEELDKYLGVYSCSALPLKMTISKQGNVLMAQGTGQPAFPLEAYEKNKFKFEQAARLTIEFIPADGKLILRQAGGVFEFKKD
jgi:D-alanyl-D-alanine carboxypeptidase